MLPGKQLQHSMTTNDGMLVVIFQVPAFSAPSFRLDFGGLSLSPAAAGPDFGGGDSAARSVLCLTLFVDAPSWTVLEESKGFPGVLLSALVLKE